MIIFIMIKLCYFCSKSKNIDCFRISVYEYKKKKEYKIYHRNRCKKCDTQFRSKYMEKYYRNKIALQKKKYKNINKEKPFDNPLIFYVCV